MDNAIFNTLVNMSDEVDKVVAVAKEQNETLSIEIRERKAAVYNRLFGDSENLMAYANKVGLSDIRFDTGIYLDPLTQIRLRLFNVNGHMEVGVSTVRYDNSMSEYYYCNFCQHDNLNEKIRSLPSHLLNGVVAMSMVLESWNHVFPKMQEDLVLKMQKAIKDKAKEVSDKNASLVAALTRIEAQLD